jgi:hydrogenase/urease accessory protein HupE
LSLSAALLAVPAFAHTDGDHHGFGAGIAHMFGGVDHVAIAALVGLWASADPKGRSLPVLGAYGVALLGSGLLGVALPGAAVDGVLLALLLAAGAMVVFGRKGWSARLASALVISLAAVQGFAHVADVGRVAANGAFVTGLAMTTIMAAAASTLLMLHVRWRTCGLSASDSPDVLVVEDD